MYLSTRKLYLNFFNKKKFRGSVHKKTYVFLVFTQNMKS